MFECVILGDSIAVGVWMQARDCARQARNGISSRGFVNTYRTLPQGNQTLISLGSNDGGQTYDQILESLREVRARIEHGTVTWLLSANNNRAADAAARLAQEHGDRVLFVRPYVSSDGVHPHSRGYGDIARQFLNR